MRDARTRASITLGMLVFIAAELVSMLQPYFAPHVYALGNAGSLLLPISQPMANELTYDSSKQAFQFNANYTKPQSGLLQSMGSQIKATAYQDPGKGISVTDPAHGISFSMTPKFGLWPGKQDGNRIIYPFDNGTGWVVYSMHSIGVKEDVLLTHSAGNNLTLDYALHLGNTLRAHVESNGSIGVYGNPLLSGNVSTGNAKDSALLNKARQHASKDTLLFSIPAPTTKGLGTAKSSVRAHYSLVHGDIARLTVNGLGQAHYPLTIDPSIYVTSAEQFMAGNNETNIDFDVADQLIEKGPTTGARFDSWNSTMNLNAGVSGQGVAVAGGFIYTAGGTQSNGSSNYYTSPGTDTFNVPSGINSITVKAWGAGGGGGGGGNSGDGGGGGGGGFTETTLSVTPGQALTVDVGQGGGYGSFSSGNSGSSSGDGGGGGGYSGVFSGSTPLSVAAGGAGGGGGGYSAYNGGDGGAGGGTSGVSGSSSNGANGGGAGTQGSGGNGGNGGGNAGASGSYLAGGAGADGASNTRSTGSNANGGTPGGGNGGNGDENNNDYAGGAGGGGGYYGGGGGSASATSGGGRNRQYSGGGGGGGGSSYTTGTGSTDTAGSGTTPGNSGDSDRGNAGDGGTGGVTRTSGTSGNSGLVVIAYGTGSTNLTTVSWAKFDTNTGAIDSADPGNGACSGWCSKSDYALPVARTNLSLVAYNGFLYAIGGEDSSCTSGNGTGDGGVCNTVYIAKLGANGEPQLWNPTSTDKSTWTYWYQDTGLTSPRSFTAAVAYENRMYLLGGKTSSGGTPSIVNTAQIADITADGKLGSWSSSTTLPYNDYGYGATIYNSQIYLVGGSSAIGGAPLSSVYYNKINSDGSLNSWAQTSSLSGGRFSNGGNFTTVWGGYLYQSGGCSAVNSSGYCTGVASSTQQASINADGSLDQWNTDTNVTDARMADNIVAWRDYVYEIGGCNTQNPTTGACTGALNSINYGAINQPGDISTVTQSVASGTSPCSGGSPDNCDLPPLGTNAGQVGELFNVTAIINGYMYVAGGCYTSNCRNVSDNTAYAVLGSDGTLTEPANCTADGNTLSGSWCVDSTNVITHGFRFGGQSGVGAGAAAVFGSTIYFVGGINGRGNTGEIYYINMNADGSLNTGGWNAESMGGFRGAGAQNVSYESVYTRANPSSAGTSPGNMYIFGGCTNTNNAACTGYTGAVYKCDIGTDSSISNCSTSGQLQIGTVQGATGTGLGGMGGTVYANYIYLIGGAAPGISGLSTVYYAEINNSNNVVAVSGSAWTLASNQIPVSSEYASAFGYNGYLYVVGGYNSTDGVLDSVEFAKISTSDGSIGAFSTSGVTISATWGMGLPVSGSYAYVLGGCGSGTPPDGCTNIQASVQTFQIYNNDSGAPSSYSTAANTFSTDPNRIGASSTILNGYIYVAGGCTSATDCTTAVNDVSYAPIDVDGKIGTWSSTTGALPGLSAWGKLEAAGGTLYYIGGQDSSGTAQSAVYYATPSSGNVSSWTPATNGLPAARTKFGAAIWNNRIYVVGGLDSSSSPAATVYVSPQLNSGGNITSTWSTTSTSFNVARSGLTAIAYANNLYVVGGYDGSNYLSDVQFAQISTSGGSVGSWSYTTSLPTSLSGADGFAANGYMYIIGGTSDGTNCLPSTLIAPISANTTIASGNHPTGVGSWFETSQNYSGDRYGNAVDYSNGKAYVIGGACGSGTLTYASPVIQQTALLSEPQVAQYSIMFDTDSDVYPNYWLLNGIDNSIGAEWQLSYRSMTNTTTSCASPAMTNWGQTTYVGNVTLGTPGVYTPLDGSGNDTNCARFYYLSVSIDSSQAYGYPDDVTRGPTITDLTLQFTADPSKRLMHGRTFTGGLQQPDDTPYYAH